MKKYLLITVMALLFSLNAQAQQRGFTLAGGISTMQLGELKSYQDLLIDRAPVEVKGLTYFPPFTHIRLGLFQRHNEQWKFAAHYSYTTSGAHGNYTDQSGYMDINQYLTTYQAGAAAYYSLFYKNFFEAMVYGQFLVGYSVNEVSRVVATNTYYYQENSLKMNTLHPLGEAGIELLYHLENYSFGLEGGYQYDLGGNFSVRENSRYNSEPLNPAGDLKSDLSGFRVGVKFVLVFNPDAFLEEVNP